MLQDYPYSHLEFGWPLDYAIVPTYINHSSLEDVAEHVVPFVENECRLGAMLGPFSDLPFLP